MKNICILGGGWLGFPLGKKLSEKYNIKISTTSKEKIDLFNQAGLQGFLLEIPSDETLTTTSVFFEDCEILIITIPPKRSSSEMFDYVKKMDFIINQIVKNNIKQVIFTSSTSVYDGLKNEVDEKSVLSNENFRAIEIIINEQKLLENINFRATVLRLGGLFGCERHPVKFLAKKEEIENGNEPVNMLHLDDAIAAISTLIEKPIANEVYNLVYPSYPTREIFYKKAAVKHNLKLAPFKQVDEPKNRKVLSTKFQEKFNFSFRHFD